MNTRGEDPAAQGGGGTSVAEGATLLGRWSWERVSASTPERLRTAQLLARNGRHGQAQRILESVASRRLEGYLDPEGQLQARILSEASGVRGDRQHEGKVRRRRVREVLPLAELAAQERRLAKLVLTQQDQEGEGAKEALARLNRSLANLTSSPAWQLQIVGGLVGLDTTWSTPDSRRAKVHYWGGRVTPGGSWWHVHCHALAEAARAEALAVVPEDQPEGPRGWAWRRFVGERAWWPLRRWEEEAAVDPEVPQTPAQLCEDLPEGAPTWRRLARRWMRGRYLRTVAQDSGLFLRMRSVSMEAKRRRGEGSLVEKVRSATLEAVNYSICIGAIDDDDRAAEWLEAVRGAQLCRRLGTWTRSGPLASPEAADDGEQLDQEEGLGAPLLAVHIGEAPPGPLTLEAELYCLLLAGCRSRWATRLVRQAVESLGEGPVQEALEWSRAHLEAELGLVQLPPSHWPGPPGGPPSPGAPGPGAAPPAPPGRAGAGQPRGSWAELDPREVEAELDRLRGPLPTRQPLRPLEPSRPMPPAPASPGGGGAGGSALPRQASLPGFPPDHPPPPRRRHPGGRSRE